MARKVSFVVLIVVILVTAAILFRVLAQFLVPLFLAVILVVMFQPMHRWVVGKCKGRDRLAAGLTTLGILLIVLLPLTWIVVMAASEGVTLANSFDEKAQGQLIARAQATTQWVRGMPFFKDIELPTDEELIGRAATRAQELVAPAALGSLQLLGSLIVGLAIMVLGLYYFLADGPQMIRTVMRLSPLDDRHEQELLDQFVTISRAVVLASLLSAVTQGILAGGGFFFAGFEAVIFLTALSMLLALIPFVGTAGVWVPSCLWLYLYEGRTWTAVGLCLYCLVVVSMVDNIIKPLVLHGQSGIHPLMALLSVLGGVTVLGPLGIVVGPMLVAFLQALLSMLRAEMEEMEEPVAETPTG